MDRVNPEATIETLVRIKDEPADDPQPVENSGQRRSGRYLFKLKPEWKPNKLQEVFLRNFQAGLFTDCTISGKCGKSLNLHRGVLAAHSRYLANLFEKRPLDVNPVLIFHELDFKDLKRAVACIYHGQFAVAEENFAGFVIALETLRIQSVAPGELINAPVEEEDDVPLVQIPHEALSASKARNKAQDSVKANAKGPLRQVRRNTRSTINGNAPDGSTVAFKNVGDEWVDQQQPLKKIKIELERVDISIASSVSSGSLAGDKCGVAENNNLTKRSLRSQVRSHSSGQESDKRRQLSEGTACAFCARSFIDTKSHEKTCVQNPVPVRYSCNQCEANFSRFSSLSRHVEKNHSSPINKELDSQE